MNSYRMFKFPSDEKGGKYYRMNTDEELSADTYVVYATAPDYPELTTVEKAYVPESHEDKFGQSFIERVGRLNGKKLVENVDYEVVEDQVIIKVDLKKFEKST